MPHPPIAISPITKTCPTCRQTKPEDQFHRLGTSTAVKNCLACRDRYRPGRKRLSEESVVVFDSTSLPAHSHITNTSYQPIASLSTPSSPHVEEEHGTHNVFHVEPPKRKKANRKKKNYRAEEPQLMEIGSMVLGPMGPSFVLLPSLQSNSRSRENRSGIQEQSIRTIESTRPKPQTGHGAEIREHRNMTVDLTGPERQFQASSGSVPPRPLTSDGSLNVRSMVLGPMGPSIAVLTSVQPNFRSRKRRDAGVREQQVTTFDSTERYSGSRSPSSRPLPLHTQIEQPRERQINTVDLTEPKPQFRSSVRLMPSRPRVEHGAETWERQVRVVNTSEPQPRDASSQPLPPRPSTNDGDLDKYVSRCWDASCTSCRSYSLHP